jgi:hypothetical protein
MFLCVSVLEEAVLFAQGPSPRHSAAFQCNILIHIGFTYSAGAMTRTAWLAEGLGFHADEVPMSVGWPSEVMCAAGVQTSQATSTSQLSLPAETLRRFQRVHRGVSMPGASAASCKSCLASAF